MQSLRKRPTYNEVVDYLETDQPKIKYPDRRATFLRNSPYLSQFDGDSWIDLEEQENRISREKLKEEQVKRVSSETQTTAQVLRATNRSITIQTGGIRNTETSSSGSQTEKPLTHEQGNDTMEMGSVGTNTEPPESQTTYLRSRGTQYISPSTQIFDMTIDPATNETLNDIEMQQQAQNSDINLKHQRIQRIIQNHLGETEPRTAAQALVESSSSSSRAPMIVNKEGEQQKRERSPPETSVEPRGKRGNPRRRSTSAQPISDQPETTLEARRRARTRSPSKRHSQSTTLQPIAEPKARGRPPKASAVGDATQQPNPIAKPKVIPAPKPAAKAKPKTHGVNLLDSNERSFWEKQNMTVLKQQAELRGYRFTDAETKGGQKVVKGVIQTVKKYKKKDYFEVLMKLLKI